MKSWQYLCLAALMVCTWGSPGAAAEEPAAGEAAVFYPPAPNRPRLQYLRKYSSAYDMSAKESGFRDFIFGGADKEEQAINKPYGVAIHDGAIFAADTRGAGYVVFDFARGALNTVRGTGDGAMPKPINITIDDDGTRYVTDTQRNTIIVFDSNDRFVRVLGSLGQFRPVDVAISGNRLYVTDVANHKVHVLDKLSGDTLFAFGNPGPGEGEMVHPTNVAIGPDGNVYVTDTNNFRVQVFTPDGDFVRKIGSAGTGFGQFGRPKGVAVDRDGILYVVDAAFENVQMFNEQGQVLMYFGGSGNGRGNLNMPTAVVIDYDNVEYFRKYADPDFEIEYLVVVANQFGVNKIVVYGFGSLKE
jgi:DNA-binding beta-propeller fold protein YncE